MAEFGPAFIRTLRREGVVFGPGGHPISGRTGYVDHPLDRGRETNYGIPHGVAERCGYAGPMAAIPFETVSDIYRREYWNVMKGDDILNQAIAEEVFDTGVNCGIHTACRFLQEALNLLNCKGERYADIVVDGLIGPRSIETLRFALALGPTYESAILKTLNGKQYRRYETICEKDPTQEVFFRGWLVRV